MRLLILSLMLFANLFSAAQEDSVTPVRVDTTQRPAPTPRRITPRRQQLPVPIPVPVTDTFILEAPLIVPVNFDTVLLRKHPFYGFTKPVRLRELKHRHEGGKEDLFYSVLGLLLLFALIRNGFNRYLTDLFRLFFRTTMKQRQVKEQMMESPLPSLLLNLLFFIAGALYLVLVIRQLGAPLEYPFWLLFLYCAGGLAALYIGKWIWLMICGWIFRVQQATDAYAFVVFTTNKMAGILLLPFIVMLSFTSGYVYTAALTLSLLLLGGLFCYRYFLSYGAVQRLIRLNILHFGLYFLAFEIIPLLLINKLLFRALA